MNHWKRTAGARAQPMRALSPGAAALSVLGLLILAGLLAVVVQAPGWIQFALGALMAAGSATFAGLAARALRPSDPESAPQSLDSEGAEVTKK